MPSGEIVEIVHGAVQSMEASSESRSNIPGLAKMVDKLGNVNITMTGDPRIFRYARSREGADALLGEVRRDDWIRLGLTDDAQIVSIDVNGRTLLDPDKGAEQARWRSRLAIAASETFLAAFVIVAAGWCRSWQAARAAGDRRLPWL